MKFSGRPCQECGLPMEACNKIAEQRIENKRLRALNDECIKLVDLFADAEEDFHTAERIRNLAEKMRTLHEQKGEQP